jgi:hypothetical protein
MSSALSLFTLTTFVLESISFSSVLPLVCNSTTDLFNDSLSHIPTKPLLCQEEFPSGLKLNAYLLAPITLTLNYLLKSKRKKFCSCNEAKGKVKLSMQHAVEVHMVVRRRGSHIFQTIGSQMAVRLSALRAGRPLPHEDSWY